MNDEYPKTDRPLLSPKGQIKMDKIHITIGTPHRRDFTPEYVLSLVETLKDDRFSISLAVREGSVLHQSRNMIAQSVVGDYLLFIDTDMCWVPDDVKRLVDADKDIVGGFCYSKSFPPAADLVLNIDDSGSVPVSEIPGEPFQVVSCGTGFMLIKRAVLETFFEQGIFPFDPIPTGDLYKDSATIGYPSGVLYEDMSFCVKAKKLGFEVWGVPSARIGHIGSVVFMETADLDKWVGVVKGMAGYRGKAQGGMNRNT